MIFFMLPQRGFSGLGKAPQRCRLHVPLMSLLTFQRFSLLVLKLQPVSDSLEGASMSGRFEKCGFRDSDPRSEQNLGQTFSDFKDSDSAGWGGA